MNRDHSAPLLPSLTLLACLLVGGCSFFQAQSQLRGNHVDADQLKELVPGTSTRADVTALIGSPTARATFDDNTWLYISEVTRPRIARVQGILNQNVTVLSFNDQGVLQDVKQLNKDDAIPVIRRGAHDAVAGHRGVVPAAVVRQHRPVQRNWPDPDHRASRRCADPGLLSRRRRQTRAGRPVPDHQRRRDQCRRHDHQVQRRPAAGRLDRA